MPMKTLSIGSAMIDTIAIVAPERIERMAMVNADKSFLLMEEGKKTEADVVSTHLGGGALNTGVSFARLGFDAHVLAKLGRDRRGETVLAGMKDAGVSTDHICFDAQTPTGASVILSSHDRNAGIFTFRGANTKLRESDLADDIFAADLIHIGSLSNESAALYPVLVKKAKAAGAMVSANPGMRQLTARAGDFINVLSGLDILMLNRVEAEALTPSLVADAGEGGAPLAEAPESARLARRGLLGGGFEMSLARFFRTMRKHTQAVIVLTDGVHGAYIGVERRIIFASALKAEVAGTAGAGDAFASAFAAAYLRERDAAKAAISGAHNAASVVGAVDAQSGLLTQKALDEALKNSPLKDQIVEWSMDKKPS